MNKIARLLGQPAFRRTLGYYVLIFCLGLSAAALGPTLLALAAQTHARVGDMGRVFDTVGPRAMVYLVSGSLICDVLAFVALLRAVAVDEAARDVPCAGRAGRGRPP